MRSNDGWCGGTAGTFPYVDTIRGSGGGRLSRTSPNHPTSLKACWVVAAWGFRGPPQNSKMLIEKSMKTSNFRPIFDNFNENFAIFSNFLKNSRIFLRNFGEIFISLHL